MSAVRWFWQVYWSDDAADTVSLSLAFLCAFFFVITCVMEDRIVTVSTLADPLGLH